MFKHYRQLLLFIIIITTGASGGMAQGQQYDRPEKPIPEGELQADVQNPPLINDHSADFTRYTPENTGSNPLATFNIKTFYVDQNGMEYYIPGSQVETNFQTYDPSTDTWLTNSYADTYLSEPKDIKRFDDQYMMWIFNRQIDQVVKLSQEFHTLPLVNISAMDSLGQFVEFAGSSYSPNIIDAIKVGNDKLWIAVSPVMVGYNEQLGRQVDSVLAAGGIAVYDIQSGEIEKESVNLDFELSNSLNLSVIRDIKEAPDGKIYATIAPNDTLKGGIVSFNSDFTVNSTWTTDNSDLQSENVDLLTFDYAQRMWVTYRDSISKASYFDGNTSKHFTIDNSKLKATANSLKESASEQMYYGSNDTLLAYSGSTWSYVTPDGLETSLEGVQEMQFTSNGDEYYNLNKGLLKGGIARSTDAGWEYISSQNDNGLFSNVIFGASVDASGGVWLTGFYGAAYYKDGNWTYYNERDGMDHTYAWKVYAAESGRVWFGTSGDTGITYYENGEFTVVDQYGSFVETIFEDSNNNIWMGSYSGNGILEYDGSNYTKHDTVDNVMGIVTSIAEAPNGDILAGGYVNDSYARGIARYDGTSWTAWAPDVEQTIYPSEITSDNSQNVWFPGDSTLVKYDGTNYALYKYPTGVDAIYPSHMTTDGDNNIWITTYNNGVFVFNTADEEWHQPLTPDDISSAYPYVVTGGDHNSVWVGTYNGGAYEISQSEAVANESGIQMPDKVALHQNHPNPFNPSTSISFELPRSFNDVSLTVYNMLGQKVAILLDGEAFQMGEHNVSFDASGLASGVYIYQLKAADFTRSKKMTLIK